MNNNFTTCWSYFSCKYSDPVVHPLMDPNPPSKYSTLGYENVFSPPFLYEFILLLKWPEKKKTLQVGKFGEMTNEQASVQQGEKKPFIHKGTPYR